MKKKSRVYSLLVLTLFGSILFFWKMPIHSLKIFGKEEITQDSVPASTTESEKVESTTESDTSESEVLSSSTKEVDSTDETQEIQSSESSSSGTTTSKEIIKGSEQTKESTKPAQIQPQDSSTSKEKQVTEDKSSEDKSSEDKSSVTANSEEKKNEESSKFQVRPNQTTNSFIETIGKEAQIIASDQDLYASIMIAQAILESASGNSNLAAPPNYNLFGIKGSYEGQSVNFATQEDDGAGNYFTIQAGFRKYPSYRQSLEDYAKLLRKPFYQGTWKQNASSYKEVASYLTGRYATDTRYADKLIALIEAYDLTRYDGELVASEKEKLEQQIKESKSKDKLLQNSITEDGTNVSGSRNLGTAFPGYSYVTPDEDAGKEETDELLVNEIFAKQLVE